MGIIVTDTSVLSCLGLSQLNGFTGTHSVPLKASAGQFLKPGFLGKSGEKVMLVMFPLSMRKQQLKCVERLTEFLTDL